MRCEKCWVVLGMAAALLAGCQQAPEHGPGVPVPDAKGDGPRCTTGVHSGKVAIEVTYDLRSGAPSVSSGECRVKTGTVITWATAAGETRPFTVFYKDEEMGVLTSGVEGERYRVRAKAPAVSKETRFTYGIRANGHVLDPAIIVER